MVAYCAFLDALAISSHLESHVAQCPFWVFSNFKVPENQIWPDDKGSLRVVFSCGKLQEREDSRSFVFYTKRDGTQHRQHKDGPSKVLTEVVRPWSQTYQPKSNLSISV